jgi:hypothetical protein
MMQIKKMEQVQVQNQKEQKDQKKTKKETKEPKETKVLEDCQICYEPIKKQLKCPECAFTTCSACVTNFITKNPDKRATCLNEKCKHLFDLAFLAGNFGHLFTFVKTEKKNYRNILQNIYLEEHLAKLHTYQESYHRARVIRDSDKKMKRIAQEKIPVQSKYDDIQVYKKMTALISDLSKDDPLYSTTLDQINKYETIYPEIKEPEKLKSIKTELSNSLKSLKKFYEEYHGKKLKMERIIRDEDWRRRNGIIVNRDRVVNTEQNQRQEQALLEQEQEPKIICNCPVSGCTGFVLKSETTPGTGTCGVCDAQVCKKCYELKPAETVHTCNPEVLQTIRTLKKDSKKCPSCFTFIFKSFGCSQMFCTNCKVLFDYNTLQIVNNTSFFHNPHYTEYLNGLNNPRGEPGCEPILVLLDRIRVNSNNRDLIRRAESNIRIIMETIADNHNEFTEIERKNTKKLEQLTFDYFEKTLTKETLGAGLFKLYKANNKIKMLHDIYQLLDEILKQTYRTMRAEINSDTLFLEKFNSRVLELVNEFNELNSKSMKLFGMKHTEITLKN